MTLSKSMLKLLQAHITSGGSIQSWLATYHFNADQQTVDAIKVQMDDFVRETSKQNRTSTPKANPVANKKPENVSNQRMPGPIQQAKNLAGFAKDAVKKAVSTGSVKVPETQAEKRFNICQKCPHFNAKSSRCNLCGCFMKTKVKFSAASCPDKPARWK